MPGAAAVALPWVGTGINALLTALFAGQMLKDLWPTVAEREAIKRAEGETEARRQTQAVLLSRWARKDAQERADKDKAERRASREAGLDRMSAEQMSMIGLLGQLLAGQQPDMGSMYAANRQGVAQAHEMSAMARSQAQEGVNRSTYELLGMR